MRSILNRRFVLQGGLLMLAPGIAASAVAQRRSGRLPRIGFLIGNVPSFIEAFQGELRRLGYCDGETIIVETRISRPNSDDLEAQAAELSRMNLDLIFAAALPQALAVRRLNPKMRMVIGTAPGLVANGFAKSLERPGGNATGMDELPPGLTARRLELLRLAAPTASRIALLSTTPGNGGHEIQLADAERAARSADFEIKVYRARNLPELERALVAIKSDAMSGMLTFQGALILANAKMIAGFAAHARLPAMYQSRVIADAGGLMAYSPDQEEQFRVAARYVDQILRGAHPGDLPITHPSRYFLTFNKKAAIALRLTPSAAFIEAVDHQIG